MIPTPPKEAPAIPSVAMTIAAMAALFAMVALMIAFIMWLNEPYGERMSKEVSDWQREQTRLRQRCEAAGGQYVQYRGDPLCMELLFNPNAVKEIRP